MFTMFRENAGFRNLYASQQYICIPHYNMLMSHVPARMTAAAVSSQEDSIAKISIHFTSGFLEVRNSIALSMELRTCSISSRCNLPALR